MEPTASLVDKIGMESVNTLIKGFNGKEAVLVFGFNVKIGEEFVGGEFRKIRVVYEKEGDLRMPEGWQLATSSIYALESLETIQRKKQEDKEIKIYRFGQSLGTEYESVSVIHFDPLAAFLA